MLKVLHVEAGKSLYGGAYQVAGLLRCLHGRVSNHLFCAENSAIGEAVAELAVVHRTPLRGDLDPRPWLRLRSLLRDLRPDLVHVHSRCGADVWGPAVARAAGIRHLVTRRVDNPESRLAAWFKYRRCERLVGISERICATMRAAGVPSSKIVCIRSGVDCAEYRPGATSGLLTEQLGIPPGMLTVGMVAQFIPRKGHATLVEAAAKILMRRTEVRFVLFGQGRLRAKIEELVHARGLQGSFIFPGFRRDLPALLPALDVIAHPAHLEGLGVALLQAEACGVPVVAGRAGGIPEIVQEGHTGFLVEPGDVTTLADRIERLLSDASLRLRMGQAARAFAVEKCSLETMAEANLTLYHEIAGS